MKEVEISDDAHKALIRLALKHNLSHNEMLKTILEFFDRNCFNGNGLEEKFQVFLKEFEQKKEIH